MPSTTFFPGTVVTAVWLNEVNNGIFNTIPTLAPLNSPTFITPTLGVATATTINKVTITTPLTGATLTIPNGATATVSGTNTGDQNLFRSVAVAAQPTITASGLTDTLTFAAGLGIILSTDAGTKTVTIQGQSASIPLATRTSNVQLLISDNNSFIDITSGTFTQTFDTCANLTAGWHVWIRNSGTGDITLDPSGAELIDGLTSYIMYPGEVRFIQCNGTTLTSFVIKGYRKRFTSSGTWTKPPGYSKHGGIVASGGASGVKASAGTIAQGGPGGGAFPWSYDAASLGATETVTVGAGGAAQTVANTAGNTGGTSSFGSWVSVAGGVSSTSTGGITQWGGSVNIGGVALQNNNNNDAIGFEAVTGSNAGKGVWAGAKGHNSASAVSAGAIYGGAAGGSIDAAGTLRAPGTSSFAGNGGAASVAGSGTAGSFPCGGGGATQTGAQSGAGGAGYVDVEGVL